MQVRRACEKDLAGVHELLNQVLAVHAAGRPDIFRAGTRKYTDAELLAMFEDDTHPVFVAVDDGGAVLGHAFCAVQDYRGSNNMQPILSIYVDDICVLVHDALQVVFAKRRQHGSVELLMSIYERRLA